MGSEHGEFSADGSGAAFLLLRVGLAFEKKGAKVPIAESADFVFAAIDCL
jgi:hypothetical protein